MTLFADPDGGGVYPATIYKRGRAVADREFLFNVLISTMVIQWQVQTIPKSPMSFGIIPPGNGSHRLGGEAV